MTVGETVKGNGVSVEQVGKRGMGKMSDMFLPVNFKSLKSKGMTQKTLALKICPHTFSIKWKGQTKC